MSGKILTSMNPASGILQNGQVLESSASSKVDITIHQVILSALEKFRLFLSTPQTWHLRVVAKLDQQETRLDTWFSERFATFDQGQARIDHLGKCVEKSFSGLAVYQKWLLQDDSTESLPLQCALYLIKLPLRSMQNILNLVYRVMKGVLHAFVHPINALFQTAKQLTIFAHDLTQPETWTKMGIGMIGAELGQIMILSNPLFHIPIAAGVAIFLIGLTFGALRAAIINPGKENEALIDNLYTQLKDVPENFLTSFFMGLMMGKIQAAMISKVNATEQAKRLTDTVIQKHSLPSYNGMNAQKPYAKIKSN